jgi:hypothetical protein
MSNLVPWTWEELADLVTFKEDVSEKEITKQEKMVEDFIKEYDYAGALALEIARWCVLNHDPDASCYGPLCYLFPASCSGCFFSNLGMCCGSDHTMKLLKRLAKEYEIEYYKVYGNA